MTRCQIRDHFGGNEIQKIFYKCIFWANEVPEPYILKWWGFCTVLWFTVPCTLLSPHFSQWMVAMISEKTEKSEKLTSQKLRGRCFWPLKNWEVRSSNLSVSERLAAPSWQGQEWTSQFVEGRSAPTSQFLEGQSTLTSQFFRGRSLRPLSFFHWS